MVQKERARCTSTMVMSTLAIGKMISAMAKAFTPMSVAHHTKAIGSMIKSKVKALSTGLMAPNTKGTGSITNEMVMEHTIMPMVTCM